MHAKTDKGNAAILALGDRLSVIETLFGAKEQIAHVKDHIVDEVTKALDVFSGSTRSYVSHYGMALVAGVGEDNGAYLGDGSDDMNGEDSDDEDDDKDEDEECSADTVGECDYSLSFLASVTKKVEKICWMCWLVVLVVLCGFA